jgi:hypothetical protein
MIVEYSVDDRSRGDSCDKDYDLDSWININDGRLMWEDGREFCPIENPSNN